MEKEMIDLIAKKEVLRGKIAEAKNQDELNALQQELDALNDEEKFLVARAKAVEAIKAGGGDPVPVPGKAEEKPDFYDSVEYRSAFMKYALSGGEDKTVLTMRADAITKTTDIGAVIPTTIINRIIEKLEATGMILKEVTRTALKGGISYPISSVKPVATWVAEGAGSDKQKKTVGSIVFAYHKLRCAVAMTLEATVESLSVFESTLVQNVAEAMLMAVEKAIISGTGSGQPKGILTETVAADKTITVSGALTYKNFIDAEAALDIAYEGSGVYFMTKKTFMGFVGQVDSNGQPIARVDRGTSGRPERTILGRRVILNNYMDSLDAKTAAGTVVAFLYNPKDYVLNTSFTMGLKRYEDNETDDQVMKAIMLVDGKCVDTNSLVVLKTATASEQG